MILTKYDASFHIKCEKELSRQEGREEGIGIGRREGVFAMIALCLEDGLSQDRILYKLQKHFRVTLEEAQKYVECYERAQS